ncbi:MAG: two pore domain potassium channel family protein [Bacteroidetes bacterium]|nr:two pore domain potassium channel family protein [Bacteroidota bacterium]
MSDTNTHMDRFIRESRGRKKNLWRNNIILLLALLSLIFVTPMMEHLGEIFTRGTLILVVISGIFAAEYGKRVFILLLALGLLVLICTAFMILFPQNKAISIITFFLVVSSLIFSTIALIFHMSVASTAERSTIICAINSYLLIGLTASMLFVILDLFIPNSFINLDAGTGDLSSYIYFGFVTLSTLGYGDITPNAPLARSLSIFVAVGGQLYLVIIMALIIEKFLNSKKRG